MSMNVKYQMDDVITLAPTLLAALSALVDKDTHSKMTTERVKVFNKRILSPLL